MSLRTLMVALALVLVGALSCGDVVEPEVGELIAGVCKNEDSDPDNDVSFQETILPRMQMGCGCHNPSMSGIAIDNTMFTVVDHASVRRGGVNSRDKIVVEGDPCGSWLYQKLGDAPPTGSRMPTFGPYWSRSEMMQLHDWIAEGAHVE
jgi:hypothetical protein